jgi:predicted Fe-Mo cluster-binding NifX family protein
MIMCATLGSGGTVGPGLGRASRVALASVTDGHISSWEELEVGWDGLHDQGAEGAHHARIARFLLDHDVEVVIAQHLGAGMQRTLGSMGVRLVLGVDGDARRAVTQAAGTGAA